MYLYNVRYSVNGVLSDFVTPLEWTKPIQRGDILLLVYKADVLPEYEDQVISDTQIQEQIAWKVDNVVHFPNCSLKSGPTTLVVSPTKRPTGL
jgi:hypothetical protein